MTLEVTNLLCVSNILPNFYCLLNQICSFSPISWIYSAERQFCNGKNKNQIYQIYQNIQNHQKSNGKSVQCEWYEKENQEGSNQYKKGNIMFHNVHCKIHKQMYNVCFMFQLKSSVEKQQESVDDRFRALQSDLIIEKGQQKKLIDITKKNKSHVNPNTSKIQLNLEKMNV